MSWFSFYPKLPKHAAATAGAAVTALSLAVPIIAKFEGYQPVAAVDIIGTGHPLTWCYGETKSDGHTKVRAGQRFTKQECQADLIKQLPKYNDAMNSCIHVQLPDKVRASLVSAAYNAGPAAVCKSPMVAKMNAGNTRAGCLAFKGWYIRASGRVIQGLVNRRNQESALCMDGLK